MSLNPSEFLQRKVFLNKKKFSPNILKEKMCKDLMKWQKRRSQYTRWVSQLVTRGGFFHVYKSWEGGES